jgi:hypothetical protein
VIKYAPVLAGERLHQGEILGGLVHVRQSLDSIGTALVQIDELVHPFVVVLTQDCDLEQDFNARASGNGKLESILVCPAVDTTQLKGIASTSSFHWKLITGNRDVRYQCLEAIPLDNDSASQGIPSLGCDFKRYFTVPADEVYKRINLKEVTRRCRLITPYAEHFLHRFCNFQARVPLPQNHEVSQ